MRNRRLLVAIVFLALVAAPVARLAAAAPCAAAMDCCAAPGDDDTGSPCGCTLKPVTRSPVVLQSPEPPFALMPSASVPAVWVPPAACSAHGAAVVPRARAAPLYLLFATLLV